MKCLNFPTCLPLKVYHKLSPNLAQNVNNTYHKTYYNVPEFFCEKKRQWQKLKTAIKTNLSNIGEKSTKVGLKETERNKVLFNGKLCKFI